VEPQPSVNLDAQRQLQLLAGLIQLEKEAREAESEANLAYLAVNDSRRLVPYRQAALWRYAPAGARVIALSGVTAPDPQAPLARWLAAVASVLAGTAGAALCTIALDELPVELRLEVPEWAPNGLLWAPFAGRDGKVEGGLIFLRPEPWRESELALLERLTGAYGHAWRALAPRRAPLRFNFGRREAIAAGVVFLALLFPVRESALAPAEVVAQDPLVVAAPSEGVIASVEVEPNQQVERGQLLFRLEDTDHRNRLAVALKTLEVSRAELLAAEQRSFSEPNSKGEVALLRARVEEREAEVRYLDELLKRIQVRAERPGVAVFTDRNQWLGRPVRTGERVMLLADPARSELQLWVPVADAIRLTPGSQVRLFLNTDPGHPRDAKLSHAAYEAEATPDGTLAFRARAAFEPGKGARLGLKGVGKIYGERAPLIYYLFRRPWAAVRQRLGW